MRGGELFEHCAARLFLRLGHPSRLSMLGRIARPRIIAARR
jgi:hypothetical protein